MRIYTIPVTVLSLSLVSGLTFGQTAFERHDNNNDGKLSKDEFYGVARDAGIFADYDANKDRRLDKDEFDSVDVDTDFSTWDLDSDSYLDTDEFNDGIYDWYDVNDDGYWDADEWNDIDWI